MIKAEINAKRRQLLKYMRGTLENCAKGAERICEVVGELQGACREEAWRFREAAETLKELEKALPRPT